MKAEHSCNFREMNTLALRSNMLGDAYFNLFLFVQVVNYFVSKPS